MAKTDQIDKILTKYHMSLTDTKYCIPNQTILPLGTYYLERVILSRGSGPVLKRGLQRINHAYFFCSLC